VQDVKSVLKLVHYLRPPFPIRLKLSIQTLQSLPSYDHRFMPSGMFVRQCLALVFKLGVVMVDVEKVPWHGKKRREAETSSI
jgi:hypothetical protein